jgi:hypothetical protein
VIETFVSTGPVNEAGGSHKNTSKYEKLEKGPKRRCGRVVDLAFVGNLAEALSQ